MTEKLDNDWPAPTNQIRYKSKQQQQRAGWLVLAGGFIAALVAMKLGVG